MDLVKAPEFHPDQTIYVGGCCGNAVRITDTEITVAGRYFFYDIEMERNPALQMYENWEFTYRIRDFVAHARWDDKSQQWDARNVPTVQITASLGGDSPMPCEWHQVRVGEKSSR